jgi:hypothetical protein
VALESACVSKRRPLSGKRAVGRWAAMRQAGLTAGQSERSNMTAAFPQEGRWQVGHSAASGPNGRSEGEIIESASRHEGLSQSGLPALRLAACDRALYAAESAAWLLFSGRRPQTADLFASLLPAARPPCRAAAYLPTAFLPRSGRHCLSSSAASRAIASSSPALTTTIRVRDPSLEISAIGLEESSFTSRLRASSNTAPRNSKRCIQR